MYVGFNNGALLIRLNPVQIPARTPRSMGARRRMRWGALVRNDARARAQSHSRHFVAPDNCESFSLSAENPDQRGLCNASKRLARALTETVPPEIFEG